MQFRHAKEGRSSRPLHYSGWEISTSVALFYLLSSLIPLFNKLIFHGLGQDKGFPYPLLTTFLQLLVGHLVLLLINTLTTLCSSNTSKSWVLGPHLLHKAKELFLVGFLFGLKFGVTNWGLQLLPLGPHLLLQSTDIMWTVLFAHLLNKESLNKWEFLCCVGTLVGAALISIRAHEEVPGVLPIAVNLLSPILLGLVVSELRRVSQVLLHDDDDEDNEIPAMTAIELTCIKLLFSSLTVLPFSLVYEMHPASSSEEGLPLNLAGKQTIGSFLSLEDKGLYLMMLAASGGILIGAFQVNMTWLAKLTSAISVGIVSSVKIIPQWTVSLLAYQHIDTNLYHLAGAAFLLLSSLAWMFLRRNRGSGDEIDEAFLSMNHPYGPHYPTERTPLFLKRSSALARSRRRYYR